MASAVLPSRNEPHWFNHKAYMKNYPKNHTQINNKNNNFPHFTPHLDPNPNPNPNPKFNPNHGRQQIHEHAAKLHFRPNNDFSSQSLAQPPPPPPKPDYTVALPPVPVAGSERRDAYHREYVRFDLASYSKSDITDLKLRLISELGKVRSLLNRFETREFESRTGLVNVNRHAFNSKVQQLVQPPLKSEKNNRGSGYAAGGSRIKKSKDSVCGQKRGNVGPIGGNGRDVKRQAVVAESPVDKAVATLMKKCKQILVKLMKHNGAVQWFNKPVDVEGMGLHDYYHVIKHPMDLGTIKSKFEKNGYETPTAFADDVLLTFRNAMIYNPKGFMVHSVAEQLLSMFERMYNPAFKKFEDEYSKIVAGAVEQVNLNPKSLAKPEPKPMPRASPQLMPVKRNPDPLNLQPASLDSSVRQDKMEYAKPVGMSKSGKLPKPKAKDLNKRPMTLEEKTNLGACLQELPPEKGEQMVHIIRKRIQNLDQEGDEIELDIESLDNETLWELERFVAYHKKVIGKMKRQQVIENASSAGEINKQEFIENASSAGEFSKQEFIENASSAGEFNKQEFIENASSAGEFNKQEFIENASSAGELNKLPAIEVIPDGELQKYQKVDAGEEDVDIGEEIPLTSFPPVKIEKDAAGANSESSSSSSSTSSSDSSSSDTDSGSSSGSDSEEDGIQPASLEQKEAGVA